MSDTIEWVPMESNPDVINNFLRTIGIKPHVKVVEVYGFEEDALRYIDGKVEGLLMLYPLSNTTDRKPILDENAKQKLYFMKQTIRNACGSMAIIHYVANQCKDEDFELNSAAKEFIEGSKQLDPDVKANKFESYETFAKAHEQANNEGQTETPLASEPVEFHFISIIYRDGIIYEMDGRHDAPINHGQTTEETFLMDAIKVCQSFVPDANSMCSILAFTRDI